MNWDALGAIAELVGAVAVMLTLIYLSIQLRQNTKVVELSTQRGIAENASAWIYKLVENPEIAELYRKGIRDDDLSGNDRLRFRLLMSQLFFHWHHAYRSGAFENVDNSIIAGVLSMPGGARMWREGVENHDYNYDQGFIDHMNQVLEEAEGRRVASDA